MSDSTATFVNVYTVDPEQQQKLIETLRENVETVISKRPGYLRGGILASLDGTRVIAMADWADADAAKATQADPESVACAQRAAEIGTPSPSLYRTVS